MSFKKFIAHLYNIINTQLGGSMRVEHGCLIDRFAFMVKCRIHGQKRGIDIGHIKRRTLRGQFADIFAMDAGSIGCTRHFHHRFARQIGYKVVVEHIAAEAIRFIQHHTFDNAGTVLAGKRVRLDRIFSDFFVLLFPFFDLIDTSPGVFIQRYIVFFDQFRIIAFDPIGHIFGAVFAGFCYIVAESVHDLQPDYIVVNAAMVEGYLAAMKQMVTGYGVRDDISVSVISRMPDVFTVEKPEVDEQQLLADLLGVVKQALAAYDAMREAEGKALENDLRSRGNTILELVAQVEAGNGQTVSDYRIRLENKLKEVLANTAIDESRILTEAAIFADKVAVDEETVRLRSHLEQMNNMLTNGGAIGRKLDFLLQEMNRESNTIGSKCSDVRLARIVVDIKAELEKIREQTQNIE